MRRLSYYDPQESKGNRVTKGYSPKKVKEERERLKNKKEGNAPKEDSFVPDEQLRPQRRSLKGYSSTYAAEERERLRIKKGLKEKKIKEKPVPEYITS